MLIPFVYFLRISIFRRRFIRSHSPSSQLHHRNCRKPSASFRTRREIFAWAFRNGTIFIYVPAILAGGRPIEERFLSIEFRRNYRRFARRRIETGAAGIIRVRRGRFPLLSALRGIQPSTWGRRGIHKLVFIPRVLTKETNQDDFSTISLVFTPGSMSLVLVAVAAAVVVVVITNTSRQTPSACYFRLFSERDRWTTRRQHT